METLLGQGETHCGRWGGGSSVSFCFYGKLKFDIVLSSTPSPLFLMSLPVKKAESELGGVWDGRLERQAERAWN